ncbi:NAD-dependent succinate-semialdehyde dehydrogenase [Vibrio sp. Isolate31]|uniref:NAD-dependent succinate-semialdehyde dehydrogenase n=1 Tax=unclassified Vibrio TaxID=2614977 RepID=UPI001EFE320B|nr:MULTISPECIES: NAD-dependent succinate-semialdehyde dehydrogenase [unclassified Vibrio]MCG9554773.1 NAD-dependent succinate-semialdehyde dehydrogenase [Vibrio sp. Isolate32]MCG9601009.1 NAD-dependent succinate-semialdehyde dehydrogenase [Vibrio sp. Isolate31]
MQLNNPDLLKVQRCFINGEWFASPTQTNDMVINPSTQQPIGEVPNLSGAETELCIESAQRAFESWRKTTADHKSTVLRRWYDLIIENSDDLATILTTEQGKPFTEAKGEIAYAASFVLWYSEEAKRAYGEIIPSHRTDGKIIVTKEPVGVVGAITPWNFPAAMITRKCAPAFAAGCSIVLKPAPDTPFTAFALAELAQQAGIPDGLFNIITGDAVEIGGVLTLNRKVRKVSFTGSTNVGRILMNQSASSIKKMALELGGNAPFIVFEDANVDDAVEGAIIAKFRNAGQTCVCPNRLFVHEAVYDEFASKLSAQVEALKVGDGFEENVTIGPLINTQAVEKVRAHVDDALQKGAVIQCGSFNTQGAEQFIKPFVLTGVTDDMLVANEETFGPLAPLFKFSSEEEVVKRANDTDSGLAGYFYTQSLSRAWRIGEALEVGMVGINEGLISTAAAPFGGVKESGLGREGARQGMDEFMEMKYMFMGGIK